MNTATRNEPIYVFRLTPEILLIWTALSLFLLIMAASGASWYYAIIHKQTVSFSIKSAEGGAWQGIIGLVVLLAITFVTTIIHELVHGIAFAAFGGSPRYGLKVKYFLPLAYATSPGDIFRRNAFIVISLAPLVVIDVVCLLMIVIFPQAPWLIWVIAFNTSGAIGDIWIAVQLLRCPKSIRVEDREESIAIYAPLNVTRQELPFTITGRSRFSSGIKAVFNIAFMTFVLVLISAFLLVPILKILKVPSFIVGNNYFLIIRWENTTKGFGFEFNILSFAIIIFILVLLTSFTNILRRRHL
jgi:Putative zincin peptidase